MSRFWRFLPFTDTNSHSIQVALVLAALAHVALLALIQRQPPTPQPVKLTVSITLAHAPQKTSRKPTLNKSADDAQADAAKPSQTAAPAISPPQPTPAIKKIAVDKQLTQPEAAVKVKQSPQQPTEAVDSTPKLTADALQQQISQLGEQIRSHQQAPADSKIKAVSEITSHRFLATQYVRDWEDKVERTGNLNYPAQARQRGDSQVLTLEVAINADGSLNSMRVVKSSGNDALDDAAKRIVAMSAPFAALPDELLKEASVLVITRVWRFSDESGFSAR
jgi:protein TonB